MTFTFRDAFKSGVVVSSTWLLAFSAGAHSPTFRTQGEAENLIMEGVTNRRLIDLATNLPAGADRTIRGAFLEWLLTKGQQEIHHGGLRLRNAIITNWLDLRNLQVNVEVQLECCRFTTNVNLSGAHFLHDLSFRGSKFDGKLDAQAIRVDGSLLFSTCELWSTDQPPPVKNLADSVGLASYLETNHVRSLWPLLPTNIVFDPNRQMLHWQIASTNRQPADQFVAILRGTNFLLRQLTESQDASDPSFRSSANQWLALESAFGRSPPAGVLETLSGRLRAERLIATQMVITLTTARLPFGEGTNLGLPTFTVWWNAKNDFGKTEIKICQETVFGGEVRLDGALIADKLEAWDVEFRNKVFWNGLKAGDSVYLNEARFQGETAFGYVQTVHDLSVTFAHFEKREHPVNAHGMNIGGALHLDWVEFEGGASFSEGHVAKDVVANFVRFANRDRIANFRGLKVDGSVYLQGAEFAGPANFILLQAKGNFEAHGATFEDARSFKKLEQLTEDTFTFNTDFGSMSVEGFAIFENVRFARSVSFRNASFANLYLDSVRWPVTNYTTQPYTDELLRLEGVDFRTIRSIETNYFFHSRPELEASRTNLLRLLDRHSPYTYDVYAKLEAYFRREGDPGSADNVFIQSKIREGNEAGRLGHLANWFLRVTVGYGREPWKALIWSGICVVVCSVLCRKCMDEKGSSIGIPPTVAVCVFYSLGKFLPFIDLKVDDLLEFKKRTKWFRYVIGVERILGYVLVPLWAAALAGVIK